VVLVTVNILLPLTPSTPFWFKFIFSPFHLEFVAGCAAALVFRSNTPLSWPILTFSGFAMVIATAIYSSYHPFTIPEGHFLRALLYGSGFMILLLGLVSAEKEGMRLPALLVTIGNASYSIYLCHIPIFQLLKVLCGGTVLQENPYCFGVLLLVAPVAYGLLHYRLVEQPMLDWFRKQSKRNNPAL
jgi:exopolysaccharide production protein ExoZ